MALDIDLDVFRNKLADCKDRAQNLHFGVSSKSLKVEEHRQQIILQELRELENNLKYKDDRTNRTAAQILDIKDEVESGISSLKYLGGISNLENLYSELTGNIVACASHHSLNVNFPENMLVNKSLSNNVNDCWNYITKLAYLSQVHLRNASHYHQFNHDINEISALLKKRWKIISNQVSNFEPKGTTKESDQLANNLKDHQSYFLHLWTRIDNLQIESKKIVPINLRQDPVSQNKVVGQCLYSFSSPKISVQDREEVVILNNSNPLTWKIQNNKGEVGEIPSVCIWIPGPDVISSEKPISLRTQLTKNWEQCLNRFSIVLIDHYISLFERLLNERNFSVSKMDYFNNLLRDVQEVLLLNLTDVKSKELGALLGELRKRLNSRNSDDSRNSYVYKESEIIKMHTPMLRYIDQLKNLRSLRDSVQLNHLESQNMSREMRDKRYSSNLDMLNKLHSDNKNELNKLLQGIDSIPNEAYKHRHSQEFIHHSRFHDHANRDHRQYVSATDLSHSHHYHLNSNHWESHNELKNDERNVNSELFSPSTSLSGLDAQLNRQDTRDFQNFYSSDNLIDSEAGLNQEYSEHVKASYSLPMALNNSDNQFVKSKRHRPPKKKIWKVDAQTQVGVKVKENKIQCKPTMYDESTSIQEDIFSTTESSIASSKQWSKSKSPQKYQLDAQTQIGVLFKDSGTQSEINSTSSVPVYNPPRKKPKKLLIDSMTQIGCFTESVSTQANLEKKSILQKTFQMDAMTQISTLVNDRIVQTMVKSKPKKIKQDCQTQIGTLQNEMVTQTNVHCKSKAIQKSTLQLDVITQLSILNRDANLQTDPIGNDFLDEMDLVRSGQQKTVIYIRDNSTDMDFSDQRKNKRIQIGQSKLYGEGVFSSQTNYDLTDGNAQTNNEIDDNVILSETGTLQYEILTREPKQTIDVEIQSDPEIVKQKGKKIQIGSSKLLETCESSCQIRTVLQNSELQTDDKLKFVMETNEKSNPIGLELKDESTQWGINPVSNEIEQGMKKNKKIQIGSSRLEGNFESSCQTGHIVEEYNTQTEELLFMEPMGLLSKEIQSDMESVDKYQIKLEMKGKKLQVGYPQTYDRIDVECQVQTSLFEAETETISLAKTQFQMDENELTMKMTENKEIQIGCSRLNGDYETSCQTGHIVTDFESQTENDFTEHQIQLVTMENNLQAIKSETKGKKVQVGYPQLNISFEFGCQFGDDLSDAIIQTDSFEEYINPMSLTDGEIQWNDLEEGSQSSLGHKSKKLQVGSSRLNVDYEASCQTGHIIADIETQTEFFYKAENTIPKEYSNNETQPELETAMTKGKKIQVGYPHINKSHEKGIQIEIDITESSIQTDQIGSEKEMINQRMFGLELIDEELQYYGSQQDRLSKELLYEGKNIQSGSPKLFMELDESCQIGYVTHEAECQTDNEFIEELVITEVEAELQSQNVLMQSKKKEYTEKEIQPIFTFNKPLNKGKKIQVGHSKLNEFVEVECQSEISIEEIAVQTEIDEFVIEEIRNKNELAALFVEEMIDENVQYMTDDDFQCPKETQEKNFQVGNPRIEIDYDTSCQAGHLVRELEVQTDLEPFDEFETQITVVKNQFESANTVRKINEYIEKEVQPDFVSEISRKSKKVQVGHSRLNDNLDVECQSGTLQNEMEIQTELDEFIIEQTTQINENLAQSSEEMIEEIIQYENENLRLITLKTNSKGKKLQIGSSRLEHDFDSSCQTGHLVTESEVQTENDEFNGEIGIEIKLAKEQAQFENESLFKEYVDQEVQLDMADFTGSSPKSVKCKKVQVGYPRINLQIHVECQSAIILQNEYIQTENDELFHEVIIDRNFEACLLNTEMVNELTQCNFEQIQPHNGKLEGIGKKVQVGISRLEHDFDASCQTGHLVKDGCNQTEMEETIGTMLIESKLALNEFQEMTSQDTISFRESEMQTDDYEGFSVDMIKMKKSKKVQVGHPRLNEILEVACQSGCITDDVGVQCEVNELMVMENKERDLEASLFIDDLIDEGTQYSDDTVNVMIHSQAEQKGKKLQVGIPRLDGDFEVSCQTGHLILDSDCQTEFDGLTDNVTITLNSKDFSENKEGSLTEYLEKEIQFEPVEESYIKYSKTTKSKKVQVGHPRLNEILDVECQSGCIMDDIGVQCEIDELMIMENKERNLEASLFIDDLIDEETQYDDELVKVSVGSKGKQIGKKLQVGISRMNGDLEVSCQTGHLIIDSESQTEFEDSTENLTITMYSKDLNENLSKELMKEYLEKEVQFEATDDSYSGHVKGNKSKKVQVGHPRLNEILDVECQSGCIMDDIGVQCEVDELMIMENKERNLEASLFIDDLIDEETQYDDDSFHVTVVAQKEGKGKKVQVGTAKLDGDLDVSCQTGHLIIDSESQTEFEDSIENLTITMYSKDLNENLSKELMKEYLEKEVQFEATDDSYSGHVKGNKSKKVQVGHPRLNEILDVECQSGCIMNDIGVQCEVDELMIMENKERNLEASLFIDDLIDEETQYDNELVKVSVGSKGKQIGKKLQVGISRMHGDLEVSCQTGHLIIDSESQTEFEDSTENLTITMYSKDLNENLSKELMKEYLEKEVQFEATDDSYSGHVKGNKSKKVQVGHPRLNEILDVECQSGCIMDDIGVQCEVNELMVMENKERDLEASLFIDDLIDEATQYSDDTVNVMIHSQAEQKGKKLQVGIPRLDGDFEVSCQTGHLIIDSECQTEFDGLTDNVTITLNSKDFSENKEGSLTEYLEKEIQFEPVEESYTKYSKTTKSKKVQVGHPRLNEILDVECQSGCIMDDIGVQCEIDELMIMENKERNLEASLFIDDLIDEVTQYDDELVKVSVGSKGKQIGKKLQVGISRMNGDLEVSCQTGHLIIDSESQTEFEDSTENLTMTMYSKDLNENLSKELMKEYLEKEVQFDATDDSYSGHVKGNKSKKVQVGHPRLNEILDVECQSGCIMDDIGVQCEVDELMIMENKERNLEASLFIDDLIDEETQYDDDSFHVTVVAQKEGKGKKVQVGTAKLDGDLDVSCQTGHLIIDSESQTEFEDSTENLTITMYSKDLNENLSKELMKEYLEKEVQFDATDDSYSGHVKGNKSKKVQVGHPRLNEILDVECQSGCIMDDIGVQCEVDELMIMENKERNLEASLFIDDLIDEETQYDNELVKVSVGSKGKQIGKKLQVGISRMNGDLEVSCQTGHLIIDSESQTEFEDSTENLTITMYSKDLNENLSKELMKEYLEKEVQFDATDDSYSGHVKGNKSKKVQVGHPRLNEILDVECQSGCIMDDIGVQCEIDELMVMENKERDLEASLFIDDLIDEATQYSDDTVNVMIHSQAEQKGKKLQVGIPRLDGDFEVSCQTGHLIIDSECQTEFDGLTDNVTITLNSKDFSEIKEGSLTEYLEKEIQFEPVEESFTKNCKTTKSKKVQVGHPRLNEILDVECQSGCIMDDIGVQCEVDEIMVMENKERDLEASLFIDDLIDEATQYSDDTVNVMIHSQAEQKGKKLQVGIPRLDGDFEVSCQTGHLIIDSECQTEFDGLTDNVTITLNSKDFSEIKEGSLTEYLEKEIQFEPVEESFTKNCKTTKSKKVQVGHPRLNEILDVECQSGCIMDDIGVQCEIDELMIMENKERNLEASLFIDDLIDEETQYDGDSFHVTVVAQKEVKGKKVQVGTAKLDGGFEVSCQTGHLIIDSGCQTYVDNEMDKMVITSQSRDLFQEDKIFHTKYFVDKEIQFDTVEVSYTERVKGNKSKKVQVGLPRLNEIRDVECQSGCIMDDIGVQCEVDEIMINGIKERNLEASLFIDDLIDEATQYSDDTVNVMIHSQAEQKGKKLQVGIPRLDGDFEVSCQTGHLILDSECQTEFDGLTDNLTITLDTKDFSENKEGSLTEYLEKEIQFEPVEESYTKYCKTTKSKKVQVGIPRLNDILEVECQSGCIMDDIGFQCEVDELMIMENKERNLEASLFIDDLIDEETQYDDDSFHVTVVAQKEVKGKKVQVGTAKLDEDLEVSCQTGHLIIDSGCQTDVDNEMDKIVITSQSRDLSEGDKIIHAKNVVNKEIQYDTVEVSYTEHVKGNKSKKVQVGLPRLNEIRDVECQSGCIMDDIGVQCEIDELMIMENKERNLEASLFIDDLIDEETQYDDDSFHVTVVAQKEGKGKKVQVGTAKLDEDLEVSCQTGHLIINSGCQTDVDNEMDKIVITSQSRDLFQEDKILHTKNFVDKEIQFDTVEVSYTEHVKGNKSKKVQVGLPRINEIRDVECQSGCIMDDIGVQCEIDELMIMDNKERNLEASSFIDDLIDEVTQYDENIIIVRNSMPKEVKGKKLQVGTPKWDGDSDVSCQTGHLIIDSECQTEFDGFSDTVTITLNSKDFSQIEAESFKDYLEKEIQFEPMDGSYRKSGKTNNSKKIQVGSAKLNDCEDFECQSGCIMDDIGVQCEANEFMIMENKERNLEESLFNDDLIEESTQYDDENSIVSVDIHKETKGKKLQVGSSRIFQDLDVSCQTGHLIKNSECQTNFDKPLILTMNSQDFTEVKIQERKDFIEKEIQCDSFDNDNKVTKSKKIQMGLARLNECNEAECQSGCLMDDVGVQCEADECIIMESKEREIEESLFIEDLVDETTQYDDISFGLAIVSQKEHKGKKLQVGSPRLELDSNVSCQVGHLVYDSECQTEIYDTFTITKHTSDFNEEPMKRHLKDFVEKEIQFELLDDNSSAINNMKISKNVQVGHARLDEGREVECQAECKMEDFGVQNEVDEVMMLIEREKHFEERFVLDIMIDETTQYGDDVIVSCSLQGDLKNKKLQVGNSRLEFDSEVSCQTGNLIINSECQTEFGDEFDTITISPHTQDYSEEFNERPVKEFISKEIQFEAIKDSLSNYNLKNSKKVQVGQSRIVESREVRCQSEIETVDVVDQSDLVFSDEEYQLRMQFCQEVLIEETIQYVPAGILSISMKPKIKDQAIQVGNPRIKNDIDVSYQTERFTNVSICQTDFNEEENQIGFEIALSQYQAKDAVVYNSIEIQSDNFSDSLCLEDNREECGIQIGPSRLNLCRNIDCQTQFHGENVGVQGGIDEALIIENKQQNVHSELTFEDLIGEEIQFNCFDPRSSIKKNSRGKKLQVGNSRLLVDSDEFTQTDLDDNQNIEELYYQQVEASQITNEISYSDKEVEPFFDVDVEFPTTNVLKSHSVQVGYPRLDACVDFEGQYNYLFDIDFNGSNHFENSEIEDRIFSKEPFDELIDESVQYSIGMQSSSYPNSVKVNKKLQVGSSRLEVDHDQSCQTIKEEIGNQMEEAVEQNEVQYSEMQTEPDHPMVSEFQMFKSVAVGVGKADAFQNFDNKSRNVFVDNQIERMISVGTATWDYDKNKYKLLTIDLQYGTELVFKSEKQQTENLFSPQLKEKSVECFETSIPRVNKSVQVETELSDSANQTFDYSESHSVSIQISPKASKFENEAHLILNYFNKQVDIGNNNFSHIKNPINHLEPIQYISCDIEKDFRTILCDKMIQHSRRYPIYFDKLTEFQFSTDIVEFDQQHNTKPELCDRIVSYLARKSTSDACFEYDFFGGRSSTDISMIPISNTKDFINLFESSAIQQERKSSNVENLSKENGIESSKSILEFPDFLEINLIPKLITTDSMSIKLIDEEVMYEDPRSYIEVKIEHGNSPSIEASHISKLHSTVNEDDSESNLIESETQKKLESLVDDETMFKSEKSFIEFSVNHDCNSDNLVESKIILENSLTESIEVSLIPKLITNQSDHKMESILTEVEIPERNIKPITSLGFVQFDNKMTSTPELVGKSNFGTQIYAKPVYDGQTQTNVSCSDFGIQVTDSSSISPLTASITLYSTDRQSILANLGTATHNSIATDAYFEDDYIVECVKSRSIITKKQEVLPKFSHDFADNSEEPAKPFVTYQEKTNPKLCDTKTQSYHNDYCKDSCSQTHLELCFREDELMKIYKKLISTKHLKEQGVQESNSDGLFEVLVKTRGLRYILNKYQSACTIREQSNQTELVTMNSSKTQYDPGNVKSVDLKPTISMSERLSVTSGDQDLPGSMISSFNSRPSHKNKRIQRGCSFFKLKNANTNTDESFGDHIEVTYTETILEESVITKRPLSKMDDHYDFSKSSSLTRRSTSSTSIPVLNQSNKYIQSVIYPSQIFIEEENCDQYLTIIKSYHVTAVYDYSSRKHQSLRDAFKTGIIDLDNDKYRKSSTEFISIETALEKGYLIMKHEL